MAYSRCLSGWEVTLEPYAVLSNLGLPRLLTTLGAKTYESKNKRLRLPFRSFALLHEKVQGPHRLAVFAQPQRHDDNGSLRSLVDTHRVDIHELLSIIRLARAAEIHEEYERREWERSKAHTQSVTQHRSLVDRLNGAGRDLTSSSSKSAQAKSATNVLPRTNIAERLSVPVQPLFPDLQRPSIFACREIYGAEYTNKLKPQRPGALEGSKGIKRDNLFQLVYSKRFRKAATTAIWTPHDALGDWIESIWSIPS